MIPEEFLTTEAGWVNSMKFIAKVFNLEEQKEVMISDCILIDMQAKGMKGLDFEIWHNKIKEIEKGTGFKSTNMKIFNRYLVLVRPANHVEMSK